MQLIIEEVVAFEDVIFSDFYQFRRLFFILEGGGPI